MTDTPKDIARLMKRCQIGVGGRNALDDAHDIMAECYGTLGKLSMDLAAVTRERDGFQRLAGANGLAGLEIGKENDTLRAEVERLRSQFANSEREVARYRDYEYVQAQHEETGRDWFGARYNIPARFCEVSNESGEPGPTYRPDDADEVRK